MMGDTKDTITGKFPKRGEESPEFVIYDWNEEPISLERYEGDVVLLNVFPDINTKVCSTQVSSFNDMTSDLEDVRIVSISTNTIEEQKEWSKGKELEIEMAVDSKRSFGKAYGLLLETADVLARSVFVLNREGDVVYSEVLTDMSNQPDYQKAASAARQATAELI